LGAKPFADQVFDYNATVIDHLRGVGAVMLGKASMIELAGGMGYRFASVFSSRRGPRIPGPNLLDLRVILRLRSHRRRRSGRVCDRHRTWGSIICPSAYCGVSGLRPTTDA